jgi:anti-sigma B factor antagonist
VSGPVLDLQSWTDRGRLVVEVGGELDAFSSPQLREELLNSASGPSHRVAIEMSAVTFMDSSGVGVLVGAAQRARRAGGALALVGCGEHVLRVLRITGLVRVMEPFASFEQAFAWLDADNDGRARREPHKEPL